MTDAPRPDRDSDPETEVIPAVRSGEGIARTREIPVVVEDEPTAVTPPAAPPPSAPPPSAPAPSAPPPSAPPPAAPPPAAPAPAGPAPAAHAPAGAARPGMRGASSRRRVVVLVALAAVLVVAAVAGVVLSRGRAGEDSAGARPRPTSAAPAVATVSSVDPSGGSGFRREGASTWRTQGYTTADFGNLKDGVGLQLDLGRPVALAAVTVEVVGGPITVELRAGDSPSSSASGYTVVTPAAPASGPTRLAVKDRAQHRFWLIWVTKLAAQDGGFRAVLRAPVALAAS